MFTQHTTVLKDILDNLVKGRLTEDAYPVISAESSFSSTGLKVQDVVVFMIGGVTHEESLAVHQFCRTNSGIRIALGGTHIHNSQSFLADVEAAVRSSSAGSSKSYGNPSHSTSGRHAKLT